LGYPEYGSPILLMMIVKAIGRKIQ